MPRLPGCHCSRPFCVWITIHRFCDNASRCSRNPIKTVCLLLLETHPNSTDNTHTHTHNEPPKDLALWDMSSRKDSTFRGFKISKHSGIKGEESWWKQRKKKGEKLGQMRVWPTPLSFFLKTAFLCLLHSFFCLSCQPHDLHMTDLTYYKMSHFWTN